MLKFNNMASFVKLTNSYISHQTYELPVSVEVYAIKICFRADELIGRKCNIPFSEPRIFHGIIQS